jgi:hypothetical protein
MSTKLFSVAGIVVQNGRTTVRFSEDLGRRVKQFTKGGATRIDFVELPNAMNKIDGLRHIMTLPNFASADDQATLAEYLADRERDARKGEVKVQAKPSLDAIKGRAKVNVSVDA